MTRAGAYLWQNSGSPLYHAKSVTTPNRNNGRERELVSPQNWGIFEGLIFEMFDEQVLEVGLAANSELLVNSLHVPPHGAFRETG